MISVKKYVEVRIELTLQVLIGELTSVNRDLDKMTLANFLEQYAPEVVRKDMWMRVKALDEQDVVSKKRGKRKGKGEPSEGTERGDREGAGESQGPSQGSGTY